MKSITLLLCVLINFIDCYKIQLPRNEQSATERANCFVRFAQRIFEPKSIVIYNELDDSNQWINEDMENIARSLAKTELYDFKIQTRALQQCDNLDLYWYCQYVIYVNDSKHLQEIIDIWLCSKKTSNNRFILITNNVAQTQEILQVLKDYEIYKALLVVKLGVESLTFYNTKQRCPEIIAKSDPFLYNCSSSNTSELRYNLNNLLKCKLRIGMRYAPPYTIPRIGNDSEFKGSNADYGIETQLASIIMNLPDMTFLNVSDTHDLGEIDIANNIQEQSLINELFKDEIDVVFGAMYFTKQSAYFDTSYPLLYAKLVGILKKDRSIKFYSLFTVFTSDVWMFLLIINIIFIYIMYSIMIQKHEMSLSFSTILLSLLGILVGIRLPLKQRSLRLIFLVWVLYSLVLRSSYKTLVMKFLIGSGNNDDIHELIILCKNHYKIYVSDINEDFLKGGLNITGCYFPPQNFITVDDPLAELINDESSDVAAFMYLRSYAYNFHKFINDNGETPFYVMKELVGLVPLSYYFCQADPIRDVFQERGLRLYEMGIVEFCQSSFGYNLMRVYDKLHLSVEHTSYLTMSHVGAIFCIYFICISLSFSVFCLEIIIFKSMKKQNG